MALSIQYLPLELLGSPQSSSDTTEAISPSLQSLPIELLGAIASFLPTCGDHHYLGNLRLTCREIHSKTMFQFGSRYFKTLFVHVSLGGLRRLLEVSRHHRFKTHVRKVFIFAEIFKRPFSTELDENASDFVDCGSFSNQLDLGLRRLPNVTQIVLEQTEIEEVLEDGDAELFRMCWSDIINHTLSVVVKRQLHLEEFSIQNSLGPNCPPYTSILEPIKNAIGLFDLTTTLQLKLYTEEDDGTYMSSLIKILDKLKALIVLDLSFDRSYHSNKILPEILERVETFPKLETLNFSDMVVSDDSLIKLLRKHKGTVHSINLNCMFLESGKWRDFFVFCFNELSLLRKMNLMNLHEGEPYNDDMAVSFREINARRAIIDYDWLEDLDPPPDEEEIMLLRTFQHVRVAKFATWVVIEDGDGESIRDWLALIIGRCELVHDEPMDLY